YRPRPARTGARSRFLRQEPYDRGTRARLPGCRRLCQKLMLPTTTNNGLHDFVGDRVLTRYVRAGMRAADLGSGPGAMAERLHSLGCDVLAVDRDAKGFEAQLRHVSLDFDQPDFASKLGPRSFGLVTAIEVIEH